MKQSVVVAVVVMVVSLLLLMSLSLAGARYLRGAAWAGDIGQPVTFVEINGLRLP